MFVKTLQRACPETLIATGAWLICNSILMMIFSADPQALYRAIYSFSFVVAFFLLVLVKQDFKLSKGLQVFACLNAVTYIAMIAGYLIQIAEAS